MGGPVVSVIVPAYNAECFILRSVSSALNQTLEEIEVIVVDDASTDGTVTVLNGINDPRLRVVSLEQNRGPGYCRNLAIKLSVGEWVAMLDADDWFHHKRLQTLVEAAREWNADVVSDCHVIVDTKGVVLEPHVFAVYRKTIDEPVLLTAEGYISWVVLNQPLIRRCFIDKRKILFPEDRRVGEDYWFALECLLRGAKWVCMPQPYYYYSHRPFSLSHSGYVSIKRGIEVRQALLESDLTRENHYVRHLLRMDILREKREFALLLARDMFKPGHRLNALNELFREPSLMLHLIVRIMLAVKRRLLRRGRSDSR